MIVGVAILYLLGGYMAYVIMRTMDGTVPERLLVATFWPLFVFGVIVSILRARKPK